VLKTARSIWTGSLTHISLEQHMQVRRQAKLAAVAAAFLAIGTAMAQSNGPLSRAQVRAEAAAAVAAGTIPRGEAGPEYFRSPNIQSTRARADVRAETVVAVRKGRIARGEQPVIDGPAFVATKTRAEVNAETLVAMQLGLIPRGEAPWRDATVAEQEQIRLAGERARNAGTTVAAK
jgi:Domain of unknown function (DUF4148)